MRTHRQFGTVSRGVTLTLMLGIALVGWAIPSYAVDGVIEVNEVKVVANGGYPFKITQPGSYRLTGNLNVPDADTTAVQITAPNVTLDLNGFGIVGPTVCSGTPPITPFTCTPSGAGSGVAASTVDNVTIRNGTVRGVGGTGVSIGGHSRVEGVRIISNGGGGIAGNFSSTVTGNTVNSNGSTGISLGSGCTVSGNTVNNNGAAGITAQVGSTVIGNTIRGNVGLGLTLGAIGATCGYGSNVLTGNNTGGTQVSGGVQIGQNICNSALCP
jgi:parallel beta-helix repeat protein